MRRNNIDIYADIVKVTDGGAKKTQIVYKCNLNFKIIKKYLAILIEKEFVEHKGKLYFSTTKGKSFLTQYREFIAPLSGGMEVASL